MNTAEHMVMRQILDLEISDREAAFYLQQRIGEYCRNVLPAMLDQVCTRCDGGDRIFKIDRLEIDLGPVSSKHMEEEISEKLAQLLYEALRDRVDRISLQYDSKLSSGGSRPSIRGSPKIIAGGSRDRMMSSAQADLERILYYLAKGYLPWSTIVGTAEPLEKTLVRLVTTEPEAVDTILVFVADRPVAHRRLITQFSDDVLWSIARHGSPDGGQRLKNWKHGFESAVTASGFDQALSNILRDSFWSVALQFLSALSDNSITAVEFWRQVFAAAAARRSLEIGTIINAMIPGARMAGDLSATHKSDLSTALEQIIEQVDPGPAQSPLSIDLAPPSSLKADEQPLAKISGRQRRPKVKAYPEGAGDQTTTKDRLGRKAPRSVALRDIAETGSDSPPPSPVSPSEQTPDADLKKKKQLRPGRGGLRAATVSGDEDRQLSDRADRVRESEPKSAAENGLWRGDFAAASPDMMPSSEKAKIVYLSGMDTETALQEIYIDNAGLVIAWPFLNHFFKTLGLLEKNDFVDDRSQVRAIFLLQYLTTGEEEFPEYVLPLNKLLCGLDIREPLERKYRLSDLEKSEARKLLEAVVNHWSALKQTSVDGLRTTFLQRNAVLVETMRHWLLRVERQPYDMLLERLPWGISMIRLSWMPKMLIVEW